MRKVKFMVHPCKDGDKKTKKTSSADQYSLQAHVQALFTQQGAAPPSQQGAVIGSQPLGSAETVDKKPGAEAKLTTPLTNRMAVVM